MNPNYVEAQQYLVFLYIMVGDRTKAKRHLKKAIDIDPLSPETMFFSAYFDYMTEEYQRCLEKLVRCLAQSPENIPAHTVKCYCLLKLGRFDEVLHYFERLPPEISWE